METLTPCKTCRRPLRSSSSECPFCGSPRGPGLMASRALLVAVGVIVACSPAGGADDDGDLTPSPTEPSPVGTPAVDDTPACDEPDGQCYTGTAAASPTMPPGTPACEDDNGECEPATDAPTPTCAPVTGSPAECEDGVSDPCGLPCYTPEPSPEPSCAVGTPLPCEGGEIDSCTLECIPDTTPQPTPVCEPVTGTPAECDEGSEFDPCTGECVQPTPAPSP